MTVTNSRVRTLSLFPVPHGQVGGFKLKIQVRSESGLVKTTVDKKIGSKCIFWGRGGGGCGGLAPTSPTAKTH